MPEKTQKKKAPIQKSDQPPDFFQLLRQQHGNSITYMRFYIQQDKHSFCPFLIKNDDQVIIDTSRTLQINLPLNQLIYDTVGQVLVENKFVYANSKIMNTTLETGREIIQGRHVKKHLSWLKFLDRPEFLMIKTAYQLLKQEQQNMIEFSVLAISNLILKLGINISKLSCILTQRKLTTKLLSIPTLSILFLQNLMHTMFASKEISWQNDEGKSQYIRQMPKVTYIKISEFINKQELLLMEIGEHVFFNSHAVNSKKVRNTQYLQFYEHQSTDGIKGYQKISGYQHVHAVSMSEVIEKGAPYGFELLFMFQNIYFQMIEEFEPDAIIFVEDYENTKQIIQPEVRALLLSEMMERVTGKVFVMRQVGPVWTDEDNDLGSYDVRSLNKGQMQMHSEKMAIENTDQIRMQNNEMEQEAPNTLIIHDISQMTAQESYEWLQNLASLLPKMTPQRQLKLDKLQTDFIANEINLYKKYTGQINTEMCYLQKVQSVLKADLAYIALALIQRTSFDEILAMSYRYVYSPRFIQNLTLKIHQHLQSVPISTQIHKKLSLSQQQLKSMLQNIKLQTFQFFKNYYDSVYVIPLNRSIQLNVIRQNNQYETFKYYDSDYLHVYYGLKKDVLVFLFRFSPLKQSALKSQELPSQNPKFKQITTLLRLCKNQNNSENQYFQIVFEDEILLDSPQIRNPTFLITGNFIYRAFGIQPNTSHSLSNSCKSQILRAEYRNAELADYKKIKQQSSTQYQSDKYAKSALKWIPFDSQETKIPLIQKQYGWAFYDNTSKCAVFCGGYAPHGESRVNKYMHAFWEKKDKIKQMGKTSAEIFEGAKYPKAKIPLFPFIYGIVFNYEKSCLVLNTNGFFQCFTNSNRLFLTEFRMSRNADDQQIGISSQQKLYVNYEDQEQRLRVVATKQLIIHFIVNSYRMVNCFQNTCVLQTLEEGMLIVKLSRDKNTKDYVISIKKQPEEEQGEKFAELHFQPHVIEKS